MWDSGASIIKQSIQVVDAGDMHVAGKIADHSFVCLVSTGGSITVDDEIDENSHVILVSTVGSINIGGKIDGESRVALKAAGNVAIGSKGDEKTIDGDSNVQAAAGGNILLGGYLRKAAVDFSAHGIITMTEINYGATVRLIADGDVSVMGQIDGNQTDHAPTRVDVVSNRGSVTISGKIDSQSKVTLTAAKDISIGADPQLGDGKIGGSSFVAANAGGDITLGGGIFSDHTAVDFAAAGSIAIGKSIEGGAQARLFSVAGQITVGDGIKGGGTTVIAFPPGVLNTSVESGSNFVESAWAATDTFSTTLPRSGYWWENWPQTIGYVAPFRIVPRSVDEITLAAASGHVTIPIKAIGGGWSFSDAALPFLTQAEVDQASIQRRGGSQRQDMRNVLEGINDQYPERMDILPQAVGRNVAFSTAFDRPNLRQATSSGVQLPASRTVRLIDTRSLASSLNCEFSGIAAKSAAGVPPPGITFHVEAGITMADLQQLLDHQNPRLALRASGGSSGATLAGALSTATHGAEFRWPLLADTVRAVHLVGPGGEQWWIEGDIPVADQVKLQQRYPKLDKAHFIAAGWSGIPGLTAQDVLKAVTVSMGTMGVIYSVVLTVVPQFGLRQIVHPTTWADLLFAAKIGQQDLRADSVTANQAVLNVLMDGSLNGTGIAKNDNVYINLEINPFGRDCWVVNREVTPKLPDDPENPSPGLGDYLTALSATLSANSQDTPQGSRVAGRVLDFLSYAPDLGNPDDASNDASQAVRLISFITGLGDVVGGTLAAANVQTLVNTVNQPFYGDRGVPFLADALTGFFHAREGTGPGVNSDRTDVSHKLSAGKWPDGGVPGCALEVALDSTNAFSFLQKVLFDDVLVAPGQLKPLIGYISVRACPPTQTLLGMQQYAPYSVMIEVVAYRSPEANEVMNDLQAKSLAFSTPGPKPLLHWGLENDQVTNAYLITTPLGSPYKTTTRLNAFKTIRQFLRKGHPAAFDNHFSSRMGL